MFIYNPKTMYSTQCRNWQHYSRQKDIGWNFKLRLAFYVIQSSFNIVYVKECQLEKRRQIEMNRVSAW